MPIALTALENQPGRLQAQALAGRFLRVEYVQRKRVLQDIHDTEAGWRANAELATAKGIGGCRLSL